MITESQIYSAVVATLEAGFKSRISVPVLVKQWFNPRVVGAIPAGQIGVLLNNVSAPRYGFLRRQDCWDATVGTERHTETQAVQKTIQVTGQYKPAPAPAKLLPYTAGDVCYAASAILQSDAGRQSLRAAGFGIERITDIRQPYFTDESNQFEQVPSFDFTLDFSQVEVTESPIVTAAEVRIFRV